MCNGMSSKECIFTGKKVLPNSNVQWNVFKGVYFYWEKSTPQFKIELNTTFQMSPPFERKEGRSFEGGAH